MSVLFETKRRKKTRKPRRKRNFRKLFLRLLGFAFSLALFLALAAMITGTALYLYVIRDEDEQLSRRYPTLAENSFIYDANGGKIGEIPAKQNRVTVGADGLGEHLPRAVVAIEDRRFREHAGVDFAGVARAAWTDLRARQVIEGGSSITEQLMKNIFVPEEEWAYVSFRQRFVRSSLAFAYEQRHSKKEILTAYLNTVYFGDGAYGAEAAAREYFGKSADELNLSQAAALAGFLHAPSAYDSHDRGDFRRIVQRRDEVLDLMDEQGMISTAQRRRVQSQPLRFPPDRPSRDSGYGPFLDKVRREAEERFGTEAIERGGLRIHTTLDPGMQREALASSKEVLYAPEDPSAAVVSVAPQSGGIQALAGQKKGFNLPLDARRQPGSSFKPIVLAAALEEGISPRTTYVSQNLDVRVENRTYAISNYGGIERGEISVEDAVAESDNTVFVQLADDVGYENVVQMARDLGITSRIEPWPSTAIGGLGEGVSPLDMASAYATFAAGGVYHEPYTIERAERVSYGKRGEFYDHRREGRRVMSTNEAAVLTQVLRGVVERGTARRYHDLDAELGRPSAGKTGTTDEFADAWYVGYTPRLSTAIWVGYPDSRRSMAGVHGIQEVNGETLPLDLWSLYMTRVTAGSPALGFPAADESEFEVRERGHAVDPASEAPRAGGDPPPALGDVGERIQDAVDRAIQDVFGD